MKNQIIINDINKIVYIIIIITYSLTVSCSSKKNIKVKQEYELEQRETDFEELYNQHH